VCVSLCSLNAKLLRNLGIILYDVVWHIGRHLLPSWPVAAMADSLVGWGGLRGTGTRGLRKVLLLISDCICVRLMKWIMTERFNVSSSSPARICLPASFALLGIR